MSETRKDEGLQALGNEAKYSMDYAPEVLEAFENKHPLFVLLQDNLTSRKFASAIYLIRKW